MKLDVSNPYNAKNLEQLPQWRSHKVVRAGKISLITSGEEIGALMIHAEPSNMPFAVPLDFLNRHTPERGGYFVVYEDGYISYSPAEAFEEGYRRLEETGCSSVDPAVLASLAKHESAGAHNLPPKGTFYFTESVLNAAAYRDPKKSAIASSILDAATTGTGCISVKAIDLSAADFSDALLWLKEGKRVCRAGWNGKDQYVCVIHAGNAMYTKGGASAPMQDCLGLKNAQGNMQPGWVPSMGDLMATDWQVYSEAPVNVDAGNIGYEYQGLDGIGRICVSDKPEHHLVFEEHEELAERLIKLTDFIATDIYLSLSLDEQARLSEQAKVMCDYLRVLTRRIQHFGD